MNTCNATGKGNDYSIDSLLNYNYLSKHYKMIAIDLSKQQALSPDPKAIQQINFTVNLDRPEGCIRFTDFILKGISFLDYTKLFYS